MKFENKYLIGVIIFVLLFGLIVFGTTSSVKYWSEEKAPELIKYENNVDKFNDATIKKDLEVAKVINENVNITSNDEYTFTVVTPPLTIIYNIINNQNGLNYIIISLLIIPIFIIGRRSNKLMFCLIVIPISIYFGTTFITILLVFYTIIKLFGLFDNDMGV